MKNVWTAGHSNRDTASFISGENTILNGTREPPLIGRCQDRESAARIVRGPCADRVPISERIVGRR